MVKQDTHNVLNKGSNPFKLIFTKILYFIIINIKFVSYEQLKLKEIMMLLAPKRSKYKTIFIRKSLSNKAKSPILNFGLQGIFSKEMGRISSKQIEATRKFLRRNLKKQAKIWINIFPSKMITKKPQEVRMGKGKGYVKYWAYFIKKNEILFEVKGLNQLVIKKSLISSKYKLPVKSGLLTKYKN